MIDYIVGLFRPVPNPSAEVLKKDPAAQAFVLMRITFVLLPLVMGIDKFAHVLTDDWTRYLASQFNSILPGSAGADMHIVGIVEIVAALVVLAIPRFGGLLVAGWLAGIVVNLLLIGGYGDIVARDMALMLGALSLFRLASAYAKPATSKQQRTVPAGLGAHATG